MSARGRMTMFLLAAATLLLLAGRAVLDLPAFGTFEGAYGQLLNRVAAGERRVTNIVAAVVFDYRALDTLIEQIVLFTSVVGVALLLREAAGESESRPSEEGPGRQVPPTSDTLRVGGVVMLAVTALYGTYLVAHGHLTPGGGFQGGVAVATALLLLYLCSDYRQFHRRLPPRALEIGETLGVLAFLALGIGGMLGAGGAFLRNRLPLGTTGELLSGGAIPLASVAVGVAVTAGITLLVHEFLHQAVAVRDEEERRKEQREEEPEEEKEKKR